MKNLRMSLKLLLSFGLMMLFSMILTIIGIITGTPVNSNAVSAF